MTLRNLFVVTQDLSLVESVLLMLPHSVLTVNLPNVVYYVLGHRVEEVGSLRFFQELKLVKLLNFGLSHGRISF